MLNFESCAVCGRTILRGERAADYVDSDGDSALVCPLCKPRAEASGWIPAELAATVSRYPASRRRVGAGLRERLAKASEAAGARLSRRAEPQAEPEAAPEPPRRRRVTPLEAFNASPAPHTIAGLVRSLGTPQVCIREHDGAKLVTVAWELSWYQWVVEGEEVREAAKGRELTELADADRAWNASAAEDGTLSYD